ncbi:MAG: hypothetical protein AAFY26_22290 [Cyanobacteria bacterium J06638_22]
MKSKTLNPVSPALRAAQGFKVWFFIMASYLLVPYEHFTIIVNVVFTWALSPYVILFPGLSANSDLGGTTEYCHYIKAAAAVRPANRWQTSSSKRIEASEPLEVLEWLLPLPF